MHILSLVALWRGTLEQCALIDYIVFQEDDGCMVIAAITTELCKSGLDVSARSTCCPAKKDILTACQMVEMEHKTTLSHNTALSQQSPDNSHVNDHCTKAFNGYL